MHLYVGYVCWLRSSVVGCRSLAGGLSLSCLRSMVDRWQFCGQTVLYGSANQANSAFRPYGVGKWINAYMDQGGEDP